MTIASTLSGRASDMAQNRAGCALSGAALLAWGLISNRSGLARGASSVAGASLLYHAWTGRNPAASLLNAVSASQATEPLVVSDSVRVDTGRDGTYRYWRHLPNLQPVMAVEAIDQLDTRRSRWRVRTESGKTVEFISEITDDDPGKSISWRSVDSPVPHEGVVYFNDVPDEWGTEVSVEMRYMLPRGLRGEIAKRALGDPQQMLTDNLQRLKRVLAEQDVVVTGPHHA